MGQNTSRIKVIVFNSVLMTIQDNPPIRPFSDLNQEHHVRILVAEDPFINTFLRTVLSRHGHSVVTGEPYQASNLMLRGSVQADIVITNSPDAFLPFADSLPILYIAASPDPDLARQFHTCRVLCKPFHNNELLEAITDLGSHLVI